MFRKPTYWLYGILMGVLLVVLQAIRYRTLVYDLRVEVFGVLIGLIFLGLGIWLGSHWFARHQPAATPSPSEPNANAAQSLGISPRELDVLVLMGEGLTNQEIADRLFVSLNTVKTHVSNLFQKLEVSRRTQATLKARQLGLILSGESPKSPVRVSEKSPERPTFASNQKKSS